MVTLHELRDRMQEKRICTWPFEEENTWLGIAMLGANQLLDNALVGTPRCGVRTAQRAVPTKS
jgi:hypothetical protein